jgi:hypothetical protein
MLYVPYVTRKYGSSRCGIGNHALRRRSAWEDHRLGLSLTESHLQPGVHMSAWRRDGVEELQQPFVGGNTTRLLDGRSQCSDPRPSPVILLIQTLAYWPGRCLVHGS